MSIINPTGMDTLNRIVGTVGSQSEMGLGRKTPGVSNISSMYGTMEGGPSTVMAGGGVMPQGRYASTLAQGLPAATLPLYQGETGRRMNLATTLGNAGGLGGISNVLQNHNRLLLMDQIQAAMKGMGLSDPQSAGVSGAGGLLTALLSSV